MMKTKLYRILCLRIVLAASCLYCRHERLAYPYMNTDNAI